MPVSDGTSNLWVSILRKYLTCVLPFLASGCLRQGLNSFVGRTAAATGERITTPAGPASFSFCFLREAERFLAACLGFGASSLVSAGAGLPVPENMDGTDLMPLYEDPTANIHETIALINVWGHPATHALAVVTKDMKYIHWPYAAEGFESTDELYHLSKDPHELVNHSFLFPFPNIERDTSYT